MAAELAQLRFDLRSWWHVGSGLGRGGWCDAAVQRSPDGLPWIPGRAVRGLVREALTQATEYGQAPDDAAEWFCGSEVNTRSRFATQPGHVRFGNAELPEAWRRWASAGRESRDKMELLFDVVSATAIDDRGLAGNHTLRTIEVTAPVVLTAPVAAAAGPRTWDGFGDWRAVLGRVLPLIRGLGAHRHRGLGRVVVSLDDAGGEGAG